MTYNPVNNIEPKFKVGDWIYHDNGYRGPYLITNINEHGVELDNNIRIKIEDCYDYHHLWTIEDAKDGDVLCVKYGNDEMPFIFTGKQDDVAYCALNSFGEFVLSIAEWLLKTSVLPATKEQRDLLFQKMREAGYEWLEETKELKKIELSDVGHEYYSELLKNDKSDTIGDYAYQCAYCMSHDWASENPTWDDVQNACRLGAQWQKKHEVSKDWSEEDETNSYHLKTLLENLAKDIKHEFRVISDNDRDKYTAWLKSLKYRARPKQDWNEDDSVRLQRIIDFLWYNRKGDSDTIYQQEQDIEWLKSLRPQPKQEWGEEDKNILNGITSYLCTHDACELDGFDKWYNWLESLKPQNHWKPTEEQMEALANALSLAKNCGEESAFDLRTLHEQLKKL